MTSKWTKNSKSNLQMFVMNYRQTSPFIFHSNINTNHYLNKAYNKTQITLICIYRKKKN